MDRRTRALTKIVGSVALLIGASTSTIGCDLAQGFADVGTTLANPDAALLDQPGRKLASGSYRRLLIDGSLQDGGHVVAIRSDREVEEVAIVPYLEGDACFISPGVGVERLSSKVDVDLDGVIAVQQDTDSSGRGEVSFVDFNCDDVYDSLPSSTLPQIVFPVGQPRGLLSLTGDGELYLVDVKAGEVVLIANDVGIARASGDVLWTIEAGQLVARDAKLREFARTGNGVSQFVVPGGTRMTAAYLDQDGLFFWNADDGAQLVSETGCSVVSWGSDTIAYSDPCETRKLNIHTLGARIGVESEFAHIVGPPSVTLAERARSFWGQGARASEIVFLIDTEQDPGEQLVVGRLPKEPEEVDGVYELEVEALSDNGFIRGGQLYTDWNGQRGTLVEQERDDENNTIGLNSIAEGVAQLLGASPYSGAGILTGFDGTVGTLERLTKVGDEIKRETIVDRVPVQAQTVEANTSIRAFIGESEDGVTGTLYLYDLGTAVRGPELRKIADHVYTETARFLEQPEGVAYLTREPGEDSAHLKVWLLEAGFELTIHEMVSEYRTVPWPAPGILYAVPQGDDQGLWFSKAR